MYPVLHTRLIQRELILTLYVLGPENLDTMYVCITSHVHVVHDLTSVAGANTCNSVEFSTLTRT